MIVKVRVPLGIVLLAVCGCADPQLVPWDQPVPWKVDLALPPPPAPLPPPTPTQFATETFRLAGATEQAPTAPDGPTSTPTPRSPDRPAPDTPAVGLNLNDPKAAKDPTFKLRGRIEADSVTVSQSEKDKA